MSNNTIMRKIDVTADYQPLSNLRVIGSVTISCPPENTENVFFKGDSGEDVPWVPGEWHDFQRICLEDVFVKGTEGDSITVVGGTW